MTQIVQAVKTEVKKEIAREIENKYAVVHTIGDHSTFDPATGGNVAAGWIKSSILTNADFYKIIPSIPEGSDSFQRVGTQIRPKSLKVQVQFAFDGSVTSSMNVQVRLMGFTLKQAKSYNAVDTSSTNFASNLLWDGVTGQSVPFRGGEPYWLNMPMNNRAVTKFHDKTFTLGKGTGIARQSNVGNGTQVFIEPYRGIHEETITIPLPASFKYDATLFGDLPTNFAPYLAVGFTQMDGFMSEYNGTGTDYNLKLIVMNYKASLSYEDA